MSGGLRRVLAARGWELALEAVMVVFAVLAALAVDEWRQERELAERVERARAAVLAEIESNRAELAAGRESLDAMFEAVQGLVARLEAGETPSSASLGAEIPDFTDAAWETARVTGVVASMEYPWVLGISRVYETQGKASDAQDEIIQTVGRLAARGIEMETLLDLQGQLFIALQLYGGLAPRYDAALDEPATLSGDPGR